MKQRVSPSFSQAKNYYDRGIRIEDIRWNSVEAFYADMGECPQGYSLERKDNNKGYCKSNCKWASRKEQQKNRNYTVSNEESSSFVSLYESGRTIREISEVHGRPFKTVWKHLVDLGVHSKKT